MRFGTLALSGSFALSLGIALGSLTTGCTREGAPAPLSPAATDSPAPPPEPESQPAPAMPGVNVPAIKVNTVGYPTTWQKLAIFNIAPEGAELLDERGQVVFRVTDETTHAHGRDKASYDAVWVVDFSRVTEPGKYHFRLGENSSDPFEVTENAYGRALELAIKHFYFQRCRTPLTAPYATFDGDTYERKTACHEHEGIAFDLKDQPEQKSRWKPEAGWHDAGNFEMYVPSTAPTAQALLMAYEAHPELFADKSLNIPESGNGVPDLLDEAQWGLRWVLSMQDPSGGFRNREAVLKWSSHMPADQDKEPRWISGVGTASTAKAASVLAQASRLYRPFDEAFAERCAAAAKAAWAFLVAHPERITVDQNGSVQPLWDDGDEHKREGGARLLAAAEIWRTFRDEAALDSIKSLMSAPQTQVSEFLRGAWVNMARWGLIKLAADEETPGAIRQEARKRIVQAARQIEALAKADGYLVASNVDDYYWGSNSNLMERTHLLLAAQKLAPKERWDPEIARDQWHWILGRNPNGFSMVTRVGKGPTRVYHLEWARHDRMPPGLLVGGPNGKEGAFLAPGAPAKALLWDNPEPVEGAAVEIPAHSMWHAEQDSLWAGGFVDPGGWDTGWWTVVEGDIYYNANLVLVGTEMVAQSAGAPAKDATRAEP